MLKTLPILRASVLVSCLPLTLSLHGDPGDLIDTLPNPRPLETGSQFGAVVHAYGEDLLVSAPFSDSDNLFSGLVYLFDVTSGEIVFEYRNPTPRRNAEFGSSFAVSGDRMLVGAAAAYGEEPEDQQVMLGKAYLVDLTDGRLLRTLDNPAATGRGRFGEVVTFIGPDLAVGAPRNDDGHSRSGAAYIFSGQDGAVLTPLRKENPGQDHLGEALASVGSRLLVGAPFDESSGEHLGAAYLFETDGTIALRFFPPESEASRSFGSAVAALGEDVLISDVRDAGTGAETGAVHLFDGSDGHFIHTLRAPDLPDGARFGAALATRGSLVLIAAPNDGAGGRVYVYNARTGGMLLEVDRPGAEGFVEFGVGLTFLGDAIAAGAPLYGRIGAVFLFEGPDETLDPCLSSGEPDRPDCNGNGVLDACDIEAGSAQDCDGNGVPDECELEVLDCNANGILDPCEVAAGLSADCDEDGIPDACEIDLEDCNENGVHDGCDVTVSFDFVAARLYPTGSDARDVAIADLDGDGELDVAVANADDNEVVILRNLGDRRMAPPELVQSVDLGEDSPYALVADDLDRDGRVDLVAFHQYDESLTTILNVGDGLEPAATYPTGPEPGRVLSVDVDGVDGPDLVVSERTPSGLSILYNRGDGSYEAAVPVDVGRTPRALDAADLDGDGRTDLIAARTDPNDVAIFTQGQSGAFSLSVEVPLPDTASDLKAVKLDADDAPDLVVTTDGFSESFVLWNVGDGTFADAEPLAASGVRVDSADLDGDGDTDLVVSGRVTWILLGRGDRTFDAIPYTRSGGETSVIARDVDGDARPDLVWRGSRSVKVLWSPLLVEPSKRVLRMANRDPWAAVVGKFDADESVDIVVAGRGEELTLFVSDGNELVERVITSSSDVNFPALVAADLDGDDDLDLVDRSSESLQILLNDGDGEFELGDLLDTGGEPRAVRAVDLEGDGDVDLVAAAPSGAVAILSNVGAARFSFPRLLEASGSPRDVAVTDLDGDGLLDIVAVTVEPVGLSAFLQRGPGVFADEAWTVPPEFLPVDTATHAFITSADFDLDGAADVAFTLRETHEMAVLTGNGDGTFSSWRRIRGDSFASFLVSYDLEADGDHDLVVSGLFEDSVSVFRNAGGNLVPAFHLAVDAGPTGLCVGDIDSHPGPDLVVVNHGGETVHIISGVRSSPLEEDVNDNFVPDDCERARQVPGDCNQDGSQDISDGICILGVLFLGQPKRFPCGTGLSADSENVFLFDWQRDGRVDVSDAIAFFNYLFNGAPNAPPAGADDCVAVIGCPGNDACP